MHIVSKPSKEGLRWYVYAWRGGPCIHKAIGAKPVITPELQRARDIELKARIAVPANSLDALIADYQASPEYTGKKPSTIRDYRLWLTRISERFGATTLGAFEDRRMRGDIIAWRNQWAEQPRSADKATVMMGTLLNWGMENGRVSINVAAGIKQLHNVNKSDKIWEPAHWKAVAAVKGFPAHILDALQLANLTGLRLGDLIRLEWAQVGDQAVIVERTRKRGGRAVIPILPELRAHLDNREWRDGTILRNSRGTSWTESGLESVWQRHKPNGFNRTIHDLRGTYVTWLATKGLTDEQIARIVGWTAKRVAEIRARYVDEARVIVSLVERLSA
ncbi:tyrosine-type recombinase/integrase [Croceicoccus sp. YJ47]|uniref:tyrosine-type recombinase/integrase n=1 Tax=Croceicoccus sp. YJ47 TaxID=2798724 RepID=UPI0019230AAA|nr:tyrosine-type recombinase/integrase [Croceicoccus sp. YJ47]QQN75891.1 tyrosine-type recombinase/integrase [Croceicoccus sp. YJ47]